VRAKAAARTRLRSDDFGGICYVSRRDDFFALDKPVFRIVAGLKDEWTQVAPEWESTYVALAKLGICETDPPTAELSYALPSFVGQFEEIPSITEPLVVNCFSTAHCPLKCQYCHADDLMISFRSTEPETLDTTDLDNVIATTSMFPAMVAVITGGDPLTRPHRAAHLISKLARQKSLVLDTSGVGDLDSLLPLLKEHAVHVRVSWDAVGQVNDILRPINTTYVKHEKSSGANAARTIQRCLDEGLAVTVQTVISRVNQHAHILSQLRTTLGSMGVRNWVLHIAVEGGLARRREQAARKKGGRARGILPGGTKLQETLLRLFKDNEESKHKLDIRCTDTNSTPNSVILVDSRGDLYTEGYAHNGKVLLFEAGKAQPDQVRAKWMHIDRFGHATRYLNWNRWLHGGKNLRDLCYSVPLPRELPETTPAIVETEAKYRVPNAEALMSRLSECGFVRTRRKTQRDEYYDTSDRSLAELDYVVRLRIEDEAVIWAFKGPRFFTSDRDYSRLEFELPAVEADVRKELSRRGLSRTWVLEKRRLEFTKPASQIVVALDEIPTLGHFAEIEGPLLSVRQMANDLGPTLGEKERRNYKELIIAHKRQLGIDPLQVEGAYFSD
jgi:predicted adenylyl cyclase CyaB